MSIFDVIFAFPGVTIPKMIGEGLPVTIIVYPLAWLTMARSRGARLENSLLQHLRNVAIILIAVMTIRVSAALTFAGIAALDVSHGGGSLVAWFIALPTVVCVGYVAWLRSQLIPKKPASRVNSTNSAYAAALAEIEEHRLDRGTWARSFAESGGDESKAKAFYIKARAESIDNEAVRWKTRSPIANSKWVETVQAIRGAASVDRLPRWAPPFIAVVVVAVVIGYQQLNNLQAVAASQVQTPAPQIGFSYTLEPEAQPETVDAKKTFTYGEAIGEPRTQPSGTTNFDSARWSGNPFDQFDTVDEIAGRAQQFSQLNNSKAWAAVVAWQEREMQLYKIPANKALYQAVGTVLDGLKDNKGLCWPGEIVVITAAQASNSMPAGTVLSVLACER